MAMARQSCNYLFLLYEPASTPGLAFGTKAAKVKITAGAGWVWCAHLGSRRHCGGCRRNESAEWQTRTRSRRAKTWRYSPRPHGKTNPAANPSRRVAVPGGRERSLHQSTATRGGASQGNGSREADRVHHVFRADDRGEDRRKRQRPRGRPLQGQRQRQGGIHDRIRRRRPWRGARGFRPRRRRGARQIIATSGWSSRRPGRSSRFEAGAWRSPPGSKMRGKVEFGWKEGEIGRRHPADGRRRSFGDTVKIHGASG